MLTGSTPNTSMPQLFDQIQKQFEGFHRQTKITTGLSMETIWNVCHPPIVPTIKHLEDLWQLEAIANQFDELVWTMQAPLADLSTLRQSIADAFELARQQEVDVQALTKVGCGDLRISLVSVTDNSQDLASAMSSQSAMVLKRTRNKDHSSRECSKAYVKVWT